MHSHFLFQEIHREEPNLQDLCKAGAQDGVLAVLVLYNNTLRSSTAFQTLTAACRIGAPEIEIVVYDNSPTRQAQKADEADLLAYKHDPTNGGICAAYNWALDLAVSRGIGWMLLLDQDTALPIDFLQNLGQSLAQYSQNERVAAIVPHVKSHGLTISPNQVEFGRTVVVSETASGIFTHQLTAINSGSLVRSKYMTSIGGFNKAYPLDSLDHWLYNQIHLSCNVVAISDSALEHNLSVCDYRHSVSLTRYRSILSSEAAFFTTYKRRAEIPVYLLRLMFRAIKHLVAYRNAKTAGVTARMAVVIAVRPWRRREPKAR